MPKLNDTQAVLLSSASRREKGSILPLPASLKPGAEIDKVLAGLLAAGQIEERETRDHDAVHRTEGDRRFGLYVTPAGLAAIGVETEPDNGVEGAQPAAPSTAPVPSPAPRASKAASVLGLLQRDVGATMPELIDATGWLPHTTCAALTGLRKKGHSIERVKRDGETCYRILDAA